MQHMYHLFVISSRRAEIRRVFRRLPERSCMPLISWSALSFWRSRKAGLWVLYPAYIMSKIILKHVYQYAIYPSCGRQQGERPQPGETYV